MAELSGEVGADGYPKGKVRHDTQGNLDVYDKTDQVWSQRCPTSESLLQRLTAARTSSLSQ